MKAKILLLIVLFFHGFSPAEAKRAATLDIGKGSATVGFLKGSAEILEPGKGPWTSLKIHDALQEGDQVRTKAGAQMELILGDQSRLRFAGNSEFKVVRMEAAGGPAASRNVNVHLTLGKAWANVAKTVGMKGNFAVSCDTAVAGVRGTVFRMNIDRDRSTLVRVYDGTVHVTGSGKTVEAPKPVGPPTRISGPTPIPGPHKVSMEEWTVILKAMQQVRVGADGVPEKARDFTEKEDRDEWVEWNKMKDREF